MVPLPHPIALTLIGIGSGSPGHMTIDGVEAVNAADLVLVPRKGVEKDGLAEVRRIILSRVLTNPAVRVTEFDMPERETGPATRSAVYAAGVSDWHDRIAGAWADAIAGAGHAGLAPLKVALLVWGDPSLYDSALRVAERLEPAPATRVLPGISALHALTAAHAIPLNATSGTVVLTTGRRLREGGWPEGAQSLVAFVDNTCAFEAVGPEGTEIFWGAYLGMPQELLDSGPLAEAGPRIRAARDAARERYGWIMDLYLLRR